MESLLPKRSMASRITLVRRVMGCARSSGIDEGLQDNVTALLVQSLLHAWNIAPGASCRELPLDQELRARGQRVLTGKLCNTGEKQNHKTADTSFLQNQPVTARGINNKNFETGGRVRRAAAVSSRETGHP